MNLESANLGIKTTHDHKIFVRFLNSQSADDIIGKLEINLDPTPPTYRLHECMDSHNDFSLSLTTEDAEYVWTLGKERDSNNILHIVVHCNGDKVSKGTRKSVSTISTFIIIKVIRSKTVLVTKDLILSMALSAYEYSSTSLVRASVVRGPSEVRGF